VVCRSNAQTTRLRRSHSTTHTHRLALNARLNNSVGIALPHPLQRKLLQGVLTTHGEGMDVLDTVERLQGGEGETIMVFATASAPLKIGARGVHPEPERGQPRDFAGRDAAGCNLRGRSATARRKSNPSGPGLARRKALAVQLIPDPRCIWDQSMSKLAKQADTGSSERGSISPKETLDSHHYLSGRPSAGLIPRGSRFAAS